MKPLSLSSQLINAMDKPGHSYIVVCRLVSVSHAAAVVVW